MDVLETSAVVVPFRSVYRKLQRLQPCTSVSTLSSRGLQANPKFAIRQSAIPTLQQSLLFGAVLQPICGIMQVIARIGLQLVHLWKPPPSVSQMPLLARGGLQQDMRWE